MQRETLGVGVPFDRCSDDELCRLKVVCLEYFDFVRVCSETVLSVCAIAEGLVAGVSAPTVPLRYLSIDDDQIRPVFRGTDDNFRHKTLVSFRADKNLIWWEFADLTFDSTPIFQESASFHLTLLSLER